MKKLLLILLLPWVVMGASSDSLYWTNAAADNDMNNPANYTEGDAGSAAAEIAATDTLFFADGSAAATASGNISVANVVTTAGYSGAWSINGYTLTTSNDGPSFDHTGTLHLGNGVTCNGASGTFHVGSGVGAVTATSCTVRVNATTEMTLDDDKGISFAPLIINDGGKIYIDGSQRSRFISTSAIAPLIFVNNGSLRIHQHTYFERSTSGDFYSITGAPTVNVQSSFLMFIVKAGAVTYNLPALTFTGVTTGSLRILTEIAATDKKATVLQTGNISGTQLWFYSNASSTRDTLLYNLQTYSLKLSGNLYLYGLTGTGNLNICEFGSSVDTIGGITVNTPTGVKINCQTAFLTITGNLTIPAEVTWERGTSLISIGGTDAQTITSNGKSFYDLTVNNSGTAFVALADSLTANDLTLTDGPFNAAGYGISAVDLIYTSQDSTRFQSLWLSGDFTRGALADKCDTAGQHIRFSAAASHTMAAANKTYAAVTTSGPLTISGGATIAALSYGIDGIPVTVADGTTLTVGTASIGGTPEAPDTLQGAGAGATYTGPQDTLSNTLVALLTCTNPLYLDSSANTSGTNSNVKSLSYTGATLSSATGLPGDTIGISTGNGLVGGAASIGDSAVTLTVVNSDSGYIVVPLAMPAGSYDVGLSNSDGDTLTLAGGLGVTSSGSTRRSGRGWLGLGVWIRP